MILCVSEQTLRDRGNRRRPATTASAVYLLGGGEVGAVGARGAVFGGGAGGDLVGVRQGPPLHLGQHALLVQQRLEEAGVAVELHQVVDLRVRDTRTEVVRRNRKRRIRTDSKNRCWKTVVILRKPDGEKKKKIKKRL